MTADTLRVVLALDTSPVRRPPWVRMFATVAVVTGVLCLGGVTVGARQLVDTVPRLAGLDGVLDDAHPVVENLLLVGSDSRSLGDPNTGGGVEEVAGSRSDTIMILRRDRRTGEAALLSIPRDLWVEIPGRSGRHRINSAFGDGAATLVRTVQQSLGVPVHHVVQVDFTGFVALVDAVGGVEVCFRAPTRDANTGLDIRNAGCAVLDGRAALAYTRSRHYEELIDGVWTVDATSDLGRGARQREFVGLTLRQALAAALDEPLRVGRLARALAAAVRLDPSLDPIRAVTVLRPALASGLRSVALPVVPTEVDGKDVLELGAGAAAVLAWFAGDGPAPG